MAEITDERFANDEEADGDALQRAFNDFANIFPLSADKIGEVKMTQVIPDAKLPREAFADEFFTPYDPTGGSGTPQTPPLLGALSEHANYVQALGLSYSRKWCGSVYPDASDKQDGGYVTPHLFNGVYCFIYCSATTDKVYFVTTSGGATRDLLKAEAVYQLADGSEPVMAVSIGTGDVFVLCENGGSPKIDRIAADGTLTSGWCDLTSTAGGLVAMTSVKKMVANRWGTYLYLIAQQTSVTAYQQLCRIKVADASRTDMDVPSKASFTSTNTAAANSMVDIACIEPDETQPVRTHVAVLFQRENNGTTDEPILVIVGGDDKDNTSAAALTWGSSPTIHTLQDPASSSHTSCDGRALVVAGSNLFVLTDTTTAASVRWGVISYDPNAASSHIHKVLTGGDTNVTDDVLPGSACYADTMSARGVYAMLTTGNLIFWANGASALVEFSPDPGWSGTYIEKSSVCFTGRTIVVQGTKSGAAGDSMSGLFW